MGIGSQSGIGIGSSFGGSSGSVAPILPFSKIITFGDSLSDVGNLAKLLTAQNAGAPLPISSLNFENGRFTSGPHTSPVSGQTGNWLDQFRTLAARFYPGMPSQLNNTSGGTNWSVGGATTASTTVATPSFGGLTVNVDNMGMQVTKYLTGRSADPQALYILEAGGNDITNTTTWDDALSTTMVNNFSAALLALYNKGAKMFMFPTIFDVSKAPVGIPNAAAIQAVCVAFNSKLLTALNTFKGLHPEVVIYQPDFYTLYNLIVAQKDLYGFTDVTTICNSLSTNNPSLWMFWDNIHPTPSLHRLLANEALKKLTAQTVTLVMTPNPVVHSQPVVCVTTVATNLGVVPQGTIELLAYSGTSFVASIGLAELDGTGKATINSVAAGTAQTLIVYPKLIGRNVPDQIGPAVNLVIT